MPVPARSMLETVERTISRALLALPPAWLVRLARRAPLLVDGVPLDPQLQFALALRRWTEKGGLVGDSVAASRAALRRDMRIHASDTPVAAVHDLVLHDAATALHARHYVPHDADGAPLLVYLHGGGFTVGDLDTHDAPCRELCHHGALHVLSVDYRLAPEHPFPAALDDVAAAATWALANAARLGADPARVILGGDSAGANLAAVTAMTRPDLAIAALLLVYPPVDAVGHYGSFTQFDEGFFLSVADREAFTRHYVDRAGADRADPRVSPLLARSTGALPPTLVVTAAFDILRDEGEAFVVALRAAGTDVRHWRAAALPHGFVNMTGVSRAARDATIRLARDTRALVAAPTVQRT